MPYHTSNMFSEESLKQYQENKDAKNKLTQNKNILFLQATMLMQCVETKDHKCVKDICESMIKTIYPSSN